MFAAAQRSGNFVRPRTPSLHLVALAHSLPVNDQRLVGRHGVGEVMVAPRYGVGSVSVQPHYVAGPGDMYPQYEGVGAPAVPVPSLGAKPTAYAPTEYYSSDITYLGTGIIAIGANSTITTQKILPDRPFKPQNFKFTSNVQNVDILAITIAGTNILNNQAGFPIELISEVSTFNQIDWPTLDPAIGFTLTLRNNNGAGVSVRGGMYGTQVRQ